METIIVAIVGSGALSALIAGIFQLINNRQDKNKARLETLEKDILRTQMLLMLKDFPDEKSEIMKLAEHYFAIGGNWYMTDLFNNWIEKYGDSRPEWFKKNGGDIK